MNCMICEIYLKKSVILFYKEKKKKRNVTRKPKTQGPEDCGR